MVSLPDLYAGKLAAALDRQHPRDLFDVQFLFAEGGISEDLFRAFLVYLVSHSRPAFELLSPNRLDLSGFYGDEFIGMTVEEVPLDSCSRRASSWSKRFRDEPGKRVRDAF